MNDDPRCCGSGTCIIDTDGRCWCGQQWNGHEMCAPGLPTSAPTPAAESTHAAPTASGGAAPAPIGH